MTTPRRIGHDGNAHTVRPYVDITRMDGGLNTVQIPETMRPTSTGALLSEICRAVTDFHARTWCDLLPATEG